MKISAPLVVTVLLLTAVSVSAGAPPADAGFLQDFSIALPASSHITVRLIVPPPDEKSRGKMAWTDVAFAVGPGDVVWFGHDGDTVINFSRGYLFRTDRTFTDIAVLTGGALLISGRTDLGFVPAVGLSAADGKVATVSVQPIFLLPVNDCRLSAGEKGALYLSGTGRESGKEEVHLVRPEPAVPGRDARMVVRTIRKIYVSTEKVSAVAGDGDETVIATGRLVFKVTAGRDALEPMFLHPREEITGLAFSRAHGLFYATPSGVGYAGPNGKVEFIKAPNVSIRIAGGALYVFLRNSLAVVKVEGIDAFRALPLSGSAK
ncbi:MAG: hypothetical protein D4R73_08290 [Deltaproteobacteria bacterium]|nr:MAG: hypothetical protein D4R73_08290 [Deltaproteobacteria bacterium]